MSTSPDEGTTDAPVVEPLACVSCRSRKLKCDRLKPACNRCAKVGGECVYPESRRKPAFKRRNVKELEERLAQVEGFLKNATKTSGGDAIVIDNGAKDLPSGNVFAGAAEEFDFEPFSTEPPQEEPAVFEMGAAPDGFGASVVQGGELFGLGRFESLPPFEMVEELHRIYFRRQQQFMPLVHEGNYMKNYYAPPHMRPPMALQYAMWTMASNGHDTYGIYHDVFYQRARQYLEADELKGHGEFFLTISHAQAWALMASNEARNLQFTRAAMSSARCVRLVEMMGLHQLDDHVDFEDRPMAPSLAPAQNWTELEERRRIFWGAFCLDGHASISTGWPNLIDATQITTHLPCSEEAFNNSREEKTGPLQGAFSGTQYSTFAGSVAICHVFNQLLKHVHRPTPYDRAHDPDNGRFWQRHRELDTTLSSAFMFLPERFRLPQNNKDAIAVHQNLNLHASVICLHNAAREKAVKYDLPSHIRDASEARCLTAAREIVNIMKATASTMSSDFKSPMTALSLYCAASVFIYQAMENPDNADPDSLEFLVLAMKAIGRQHSITRTYLNQIITDVERNGVSTSFRMPKATHSHEYCGRSIPLLPVLPGRLPLGKPQGDIFNPSINEACSILNWGGLAAPTDSGDKKSNKTGDNGPANKRKRMSPEPKSTDPLRSNDINIFFEATHTPNWLLDGEGGQRSGSIGGKPMGADADFWEGWGDKASPARQVSLPDRTTTPSASGSSSSPSMRSGPTTATASTATNSTATSRAGMLRFSGMGPAFSLEDQAELLSGTAASTPGTGGMGPAASMLCGDMSMFQGMDQWGNITDPDLFAQMTASLRRGDPPGDTTETAGTGNTGHNVGTSTEGSCDPWVQLC
ncbi:fungal-specific transcription factor domain-containing protein [Lasiosphaeris hirsuta]|uniref:Fungal-specific transcription factor domain-containing protein n=1 Tax=Lasiosphaeris hirsuta TaxID=260670 RepID=A0AA40A7S3_9PEZI|nr:fungal-specific transcription factor domain-containing protein [Lasiosphaeris hirsuta]